MTAESAFDANIRRINEAARAAGQITEVAAADPSGIAEAEIASLVEPAVPLHQMGYDARHAHAAAAWGVVTRDHASPFWRGAGQRTIGQFLADARGEVAG